MYKERGKCSLGGTVRREEYHAEQRVTGHAKQRVTITRYSVRNE